MELLNHLTDEEVVNHIKRQKSKEGCALLYRRYAHLVFGWCLRYLKNQSDSEDAVMDIWEHLMLNLGKYEVKDFKNWLFLVTRNHCFQLLRGKTRILVDELHSEKKTSENVDSLLEDHLRIEQLEDTLHEEIENLKDEQRICINLFYLQGKSYKEISESTGFDSKLVKSYIQNGKRNLGLKLQSLFKGQS